jgi:hypothetical protein
MFYLHTKLNYGVINMADVASILAEFQAGIEGKDTGLGANCKI